jgi:hypothetical protein
MVCFPCGPPVLSSPVLSSPVLSSPVLASAVLSDDPAPASGLLRSDGLAWHVADM